MSDSKPDDGMITINLDGREVRCPPGTNIVEVAASAGTEIPHYCYHPKLSVSGNCRMCLVELGLPGRNRTTGQPILAEDGMPVIQWFPGPAIACNTKAAPGMHIRTKSEMVKQCREGVMEFLLLNHPLDCPICDQAGECRLQEFATDYGRGYSRFVERKNVKPKRTVIGPRVILDDERCILCSRCIRFSREIANDDVLGFVDRGSYTTLTCYPGKRLENNYSLNTVDICPVGALTSTDFRFKMRVWFLKKTPGICAGSSVGVNTEVWSREGVIYRITPRRNDEVNDTWMPDSGRELYKRVDAENRLTVPLIDGRETAPDMAWKLAHDQLRSGPAAVVGSGRSTVEEQYLTRRLAEALKAPAWMVGRTGDGDGLLISSDRNPNVRGALVTGLIKELPSSRLSGLAAKIDAGEVSTVLSVGEDIVAAGLTPEQVARVAVIYVATHADPLTALARVTLPARTVFEKSGSFINQQFRLQKFQPAVPGPAGPNDDLAILARLLRRLTGGEAPFTVEEVWTELSASSDALTGISFNSIPETGRMIAADAWKDLPFCEGESLHYKPAAIAALT